MSSKEKLIKAIFVCAFLFFVGGVRAQLVKLSVPEVSLDCTPVFHDGKKYGLSDIKGELVASPMFDSVVVFNELYSRDFFIFDQQIKEKEYYEQAIRVLQSYAAVLYDGKWGFVELRPLLYGDQLFIICHIFDEIKLDFGFVDIMTGYNWYPNSWVWIEYFDEYGMVNNQKYSIIRTLIKHKEYIKKIVQQQGLGFGGSGYNSNEPKTEPKTEPRIASCFDSSKAYNVNVYDINGNWFEAGLYIESQSKPYIKLKNKLIELIPSKNDSFKYQLKGTNLYVK